jgi:hypothetical protein
MILSTVDIPPISLEQAKADTSYAKKSGYGPVQGAIDVTPITPEYQPLAPLVTSWIGKKRELLKPENI